MQSRIRNAALACGLAAAALTAAQAQDLKSFEQKITTKVLPNGLTLLKKWLWPGWKRPMPRTKRNT